MCSIFVLWSCSSGNDSTSVTATDSGGSSDTSSERQPVLGNINITSGLSDIMADGRSKLTLTVSVNGLGGRPVQNGTIVPLSASLGTVSAVSPVVDGKLTLSYTAGTWPGKVILSAPGWGETRPFALLTGDSISAQMHLHGSISEGNGSMAHHSEQAEQTNVDLLWWTDHDFLYYPEHYIEITGENFDSCSVQRDIQTWPSTEYRTATWVMHDSSADRAHLEAIPDAAMEGKCGGRLTISANDSSSQQIALFGLEMSPEFHYKSLLGEVTLEFSFRPGSNHPSAEFWVQVPLSERPAGSASSSRVRQIRFYHSTATYEDTAAVHYVKLEGTAGEWTTVSANITDLARTHFGEDAVDLHAEFIRVGAATKNRLQASFDIDSIKWNQQFTGEKLKERQENYLSNLEHAPMHLVGQELSLFGDLHLNAFGSDVPFLPYWEDDFWDGNLATDFVRAHNGLTSCTHMFGVGLDLFNEDAMPARTENVLNTYLETDVHGCDLIEVGYRERGGQLQDFFTVWDALSQNQLYLTGLGVSDIHNEVAWDSYINNFVTWVRTASHAETDVLWGLQRGTAWFGDPNHFPDGVDVTLQAPDYNATMGQFVVGAEDPVRLTLSISTLPDDAVVTLVENGQPLDSWVATEGSFAAEHTVKPKDHASYRIEVTTADGVELLYSNPLFFVPDSDGLPPERIPAP